MFLLCFAVFCINRRSSEMKNNKEEKVTSSEYQLQVSAAQAAIED